MSSVETKKVTEMTVELRETKPRYRISIPYETDRDAPVFWDDGSDSADWVEMDREHALILFYMLGSVLGVQMHRLPTLEEAMEQ